MRVASATKSSWAVTALFALAIGCSGPDPAAAQPVPSQPVPTQPAPTPSAPAQPAPTADAPTAPAAMPDPTPAASPSSSPAPAASAVATFANGCFWCTEAVLEQLPGVLDVVSGYMGGDVDDPTYDQVCGGETGHAECVQVTFAQLLDWFFRSHDPTTLNRQGADVGTQYRSAVFFHSDEQKAQTLAAIKQFQPSFGSPIVTEVAPARRFWPAEAYHQDYFRRNPNQGYCRMVIAPKLKKLGLQSGK